MWELHAVYRECCGPDYDLANVYLQDTIPLDRMVDLLHHLAKGHMTANPVKQHPALQTPDWVNYDELVTDVYYFKARYRGGDILSIYLQPVDGGLSPEIQVLDKVQPEIPHYQHIDPRSDGMNMKSQDYTQNTFKDWLGGWISPTK